MNPYPPEEVYSLRRQLRGAAVSIAANIAEGFGRYHHKDNLKFLYNARGSLAETESLLLLAEDLGYVDGTTSQKTRNLCQRELKVLNGYIRSVRARITGLEVTQMPANHQITSHPMTGEAP